MVPHFNPSGKIDWFVDTNKEAYLPHFGYHKGDEINVVPWDKTNYTYFGYSLPQYDNELDLVLDSAQKGRTRYEWLIEAHKQEGLLVGWRIGYPEIFIGIGSKVEFKGGLVKKAETTVGLGPVGFSVGVNKTKNQVKREKAKLKQKKAIEKQEKAELKGQLITFEESNESISVPIQPISVAKEKEQPQFIPLNLSTPQQGGMKSQ
jgi:hypothetical protein